MGLVGEGLPNHGGTQKKGPASKLQSHPTQASTTWPNRASLDYFYSSPLCMYRVLRSGMLVFRVRNGQLSKYGFWTGLYFFTLLKCAELGKYNACECARNQEDSVLNTQNPKYAQFFKRITSSRSTLKCP